LGKGLALSSLNRNLEALLAFDKAKDLNPQDPFIWVNRGITLEKLGNWQEALKSYQKAAIDLHFLPAHEYLDRLQQKF
jgi:eukaryotic-like serine/threonine-protein kinase